MGLSHLTGQYGQHAFVQIHNGVVRPLVPIDFQVRVQPHDKEVTLRVGGFQEVQVANVEEVEGASYVYNL